MSLCLIVPWWGKRLPNSAAVPGTWLWWTAANALLRAAAQSSAAHSYPGSDSHSTTEGPDIFLLLQRVIVCYSGRREVEVELITPQNEGGGRSSGCFMVVILKWKIDPGWRFKPSWSILWLCGKKPWCSGCTQIRYLHSSWVVGAFFIEIKYLLFLTKKRRPRAFHQIWSPRSVSPLILLGSDSPGV